MTAGRNVLVSRFLPLTLHTCAQMPPPRSNRPSLRPSTCRTMALSVPSWWPRPAQQRCKGARPGRNRNPSWTASFWVEEEGLVLTTA